MRPDEHKAKESRRYQARKKKQGDDTASQVADARRKAARDKGVGIASIRRRNGEQVETEEDKEERKKLQAKFARRKIQSNSDRYVEESEQEAMQRDAEMGIDRETTNLVTMLEENKDDDTGSSFFKFKEEQLFDDKNLKKQNELHKNILQVDFNSFESILAAVDTRLVLNLSEDEDELVQSALNEHPVVLDKPMVPAFNKNAKGYVLFKSQPTVIEKEVDGIYLRNDGSNHIKPIIKDKETDELDQLLSLKTKHTEAEVKPSYQIPVKKELPKPGSIKKPAAQKKAEKEVDDEAWLDDILG